MNFVLTVLEQNEMFQRLLRTPTNPWGPDGMHPQVLRELSDVIAEPIERF